jgi:hypothetical protein
MKHLAEENIPRHRIADVTFDSVAEARRRLLNSEFCVQCQKLALRTRDDAHSYIGLLVSRRYRAVRSNDFTLAPYRCPHNHNTWHVGRDRNLAQLGKGGTL